MKAIRVHTFGGSEVLQLDDVPDPTPGPGQVVVRVRAAGVNPVDTYVRSGNYAMLPTLPYIPGNDCAGVIETVGEGVTRYVNHALRKLSAIGYRTIPAPHRSITSPLCEFVACD